MGLINGEMDVSDKNLVRIMEEDELEDDRSAQIIKMIRCWRMAIVIRWTEQNRNGKR